MSKPRVVAGAHGRTLSKALIKDVVRYCEEHIEIHDVEMGTTHPLSFNEIQKDFIQRSHALRLFNVVDATIKARQVGSTVGIGALVLGLMKFVPGIVITWINLDEQGTRIVRRKLEQMRQSIEASPGSNYPGIRHDSEDHLVLQNGSVLVWDEAGGAPQTAGRAGRADTIDLAILCEMASWEYAEKTLVALKPAVNSTKGGIIIDSTPPEFEGQGTEYLQHVNAIRSGKMEGTLFFWAWWRRSDYRGDAPALAPYSKRERWLMTRHGVDLFQIAWRRKMKGDPSVGPRFQYVYPETIAEALAPRATSAFSLEVIRELTLRDAEDAWEEGLDVSFPEELYQDGYDVLRDKKCCKIFKLPTPKLDEFTHRRLQKRVLRGGGASSLHAHVRRATRARGYVHQHWIGVDSSDGEISSDYQAAKVVDSRGDICAVLRCKMTPIKFASAVARLILWYDASAYVEINARSGMLVYEYLVEMQGLEALLARGAHACLVDRIPNVHKLTSSDRTTRPAIYEQFLAHLNTPGVVKTKWQFDEMLPWDSEKKKARKGSVDDLLDTDGMAMLCRKDFPVKASDAGINPMGYGSRSDVKAFTR